MKKLKSIDAFVSNVKTEKFNLSLVKGGFDDEEVDWWGDNDLFSLDRKITVTGCVPVPGQPGFWSCDDPKPAPSDPPKGIVGPKPKPKP
jgi:hypothetical protein